MLLSASETLQAKSSRGGVLLPPPYGCLHPRKRVDRPIRSLHEETQPGPYQEPLEERRSSNYQTSSSSSPDVACNGRKQGGISSSGDHVEELLWETPSRQYQPLLTLSIMGCDSTSALLQLLLHHQPRLNSIHISAAFHRTIKLYRQEAQRSSWRTARMITGALLPLLTSELQDLMPQLAQQPRVIASIIHSLGCLDVRDRDLLGGLAGLAQGCMAELSTQGLANMLWAFARCEYQPSAGWMSAYVCACRAKITTFRPQELATVVWALAKLKYKLSPDMQQDFLNQARALFPTTGSQALCMLVYALSVTGHHPGEEWLESFVEAALQHPGLRKFNPQGCSQMLWALSRIGYKPSPAMTAAVHEHLTQGCRMQNFKSIDVATTLYALARMQLPMSRDLLRLILDKVQGHMFAFQPSQLANTGWALARLHLQLRQLRQWQQAVQQHSPQRGLQQKQEQRLHQGMELSQDSNALDGPQQDLQQQLPLHSLEEHSVPGPSNSKSSVTGSGRSSTKDVHGADSRQQPNYPLPVSTLRKYLAACYGSLDRFTSLDLSMTSWALATLRVAPPASFLSVFLRRIEQVGAEFAPQEVANTLWALARIGVKPPAPIMAEFFSATDRRLSSFKPHELSSMVWALAKMSFTPDKAWADEFLHATFHKLPALGTQGLTNVIWALAAMPLRPPPAWLYAFVKVVTTEKAGMMVGEKILVSKSLRALAEGLQLQKVDECIMELEHTSRLAPPSQTLVAATSDPRNTLVVLHSSTQAKSNHSSLGMQAREQNQLHELPKVSIPGGVVAAVQQVDQEEFGPSGGHQHRLSKHQQTCHQTVPGPSTMEAMRKAEMVRAVADVGITPTQALLLQQQQAKVGRSKGGTQVQSKDGSEGLQKPQKVVAGGKRVEGTGYCALSNGNGLDKVPGGVLADPSPKSGVNNGELPSSPPK